MELIIDIPEDLYKATVNGLEADEIWDLRLAVKNGTPLDDVKADIEQKAYLDGFEGCAECVEKYLSDEDKKRLECLVSALRNSVSIDWGEESEDKE